MLQHVITQNDGELTVSVDTGAVSGTASQGFYVTSDGAVEVALDGTITHYINGLPFDANGRLVISTDTVFAYSNGIPVTSTGAVALSADAATYYNNGIPFAGGAIAATGLYGPELVTNGGFDSDGVWVKGPGWSIAGGKASISSAQAGGSTIKQNGIADDLSSKTYRYSVDVLSMTGVSQIKLGGGGGGLSEVLTLELGPNVTEFQSTNPDTEIQIVAVAGASVEIDNVSVREIL